MPGVRLTVGGRVTGAVGMCLAADLIVFAAPVLRRLSGYLARLLPGGEAP
jgi:hypothetical protein